MSGAKSEQIVTVWDPRVQTRVFTSGNGPPLVYLHGPVGLYWDGFLDFLSQEYTVYAPEHPGTSPDNPHGIDAFDDLADLILFYDELFEELGIEQPILVGHSFGAMIAAEIAAYYPDKVKGLVLIAPLGLWRDDSPVARYQMMGRDEMARISFYDRTGPVASAILPTYRAAFIETEGLAGDDKAIQDAVLRSTWALACTGKLTWPIPDLGLNKRLHRIKAPTLLLWGAQDGLVPPVYADEFAKGIKNAEVEIVEQAAHLPQLEQPQAAQVAVSRFLESLGSQAGVAEAEARR